MNTHRSPFNSNDMTALQARIRELEEEADVLDAEGAELEQESEMLRDETESIKRHNKALFVEITTNQEKKILQNAPSHPSQDITMAQNSVFSAAGDSMNQSTLNDLQQPSLSMSQAPNDQLQESSVGDIHSMYQDLFLTDIKREVEHAQKELKQCKQEQNNANREFTSLKKENAQLHATLKRYRLQLQDLSTSYPKGGSKLD